MASPNGNGNGQQASPYQERLLSWCRGQGQRTPSFQIVSDRRGGRTAWSCIVTMQPPAGSPQPLVVHARFWYDGAYVNNAREDAAEKTLQILGILPQPPQHPGHMRPQTQSGQFFGAINSNN